MAKEAIEGIKGIVQIIMKIHSCETLTFGQCQKKILLEIETLTPEFKEDEFFQRVYPSVFGLCACEEKIKESQT